MRRIELLDRRQVFVPRRHSSALFSASSRAKRGLSETGRSEDVLEGPPPPFVEPEHPPIGQGVLGGVDSRLEQKLRDGLVRRDGGLLEQRLDVRGRPNLNALRLVFGE